MSKKNQTKTSDMLCPFKRMEKDTVVTKDNEYLAFMKITTRNINGMNGNEQYRVMDQLDLLMRFFDDELSILTMMFPANINEPLQFWNKKLVQARLADDNLRALRIVENIQRLLWVESNLANLEFMFVLYSKSLPDLNYKKTQLKRSGGQLLGIKDMRPGAIEQVLFKLNNLNSEI